MKIKSYNPYNHEPLGEFNATRSDELQTILSEGMESKQEWQNRSLSDRSDSIREVKNLVDSNLDDIVSVVVSETGMPISEAISSVKKLADRIEFLCDKTPIYLEDETYDLKDGRKNIVTYNPVGTVACIMPWNHPFIIPFWSIVPALIAGNQVIYKPSELTPLVGEQISNIFSSLDIPDYLFATVYGDGNLGRELSSSEDVNMVSFAGSVNVGKKVFAQAAQNMKKLVLENGGKDALIVGNFSDKEYLSNEILKGAFRHAGQLCSSVRRVYILDKDIEEYLDLFNTHISKYKIGDPFDSETYIGPLKTMKQVGDLQDKISNALGNGAKTLFGNKCESNFFYPTILYNTNEDMQVVREEVFGPLLPIISVSSIDEAIQRANTSIFGLNGSIWHDDTSEGIRYAQNLEVGTVTINSLPGTHNYCTWHGVKMSGVGNILSKEGVQQFSNRKNIRYQLE